ncbi:hypothetical protein FQN55_008840 [Onygenales sp. PD_40]|nr:hypothetical protein FQN55_008840 [Onygenales sp. PD_40]KAK2781926.1 hypothetical protein FQN53_000269 [Emmonsiellopsis sp. PD_33]
MFAILTFLFFAGHVAADRGEDFSNNLFTDLAPLLALFGEKFTMQFMSQSMGWADNIILAMAPLGIITAVVAATRVGGPSWLKAIVGRARENLAVAEAELMSSTSKDVCEMWNGQQVVRVMGQGQIREFIILIPDDNDDGEELKKLEDEVIKAAIPENEEEEPTTMEDEKEKAATIGVEIHTLQGVKQRCLEDLDEKSEEQFPWLDANQKEVLLRLWMPSRCYVVRNLNTDAPNITFNIHNSVGRKQLRVVAAIGIAVQLGILIYFGFLTYHPTLSFPKDGDPVAGYAFPCASSGTALLVTGMLICSHVVESSTKEHRYRVKKGWQAQIVWLQRNGIVNDQSFQSYAIFADSPRSIITTSQRYSKRWMGGDKGFGRGHTKEERDNTSYIMEVKVIVGTIITICGFVVQFIGLRGMHWSASVAQLGGILLMTILRAYVRLGLAKLPKCQPLPSGYELDWLASTLGGDSQYAPWLDSSHISKNKHDRPWKKGGWDWGIVSSRGASTCKGLASSPQIHDQIPVDSSTGMGFGSATNPDIQEQSPKIFRKDKWKRRNDRWIHPKKDNATMRIRTGLGKLAGWPSHARIESVSVARAIEVTMDTLFGHEKSSLTWTLNTPNGELIFFRTERPEKESWRAYSEEIEAALSLWLYSVNEKEEDPSPEPLNEHTYPQMYVTDDPRATNPSARPKTAVQVLGLYTNRLLQDLRWWTPNGGSDLFGLQKPNLFIRTVEADHHRVLGLRVPITPQHTKLQYSHFMLPDYGDDIPFRSLQSDKWDETTAHIASQSRNPLSKVFAQHIFFNFMLVAAKMLEEPIAGEVEIQSKVNKGSSFWEDFTLHNPQLSKLAQDIQETGLGSLEEVWYCLLPPLSIENKLPRVTPIIDRVRQRAAPYELSGNWKEILKPYSGLARVAQTFPKHNDLAIKVTALLLECLRRVMDTIDLFLSQKHDPKDISVLDSVKSEIEDMLEGARDDILPELMTLYERQGRPWTLPPGVHTKSHLQDYEDNEGTEKKNDKENRPSEQFNFSTTYDITQRWAQRRFQGIPSTEVNDRDIHGWTPLYYAVVGQSDKSVMRLLQDGADVQVQDISGWTPLHYASHCGNIMVSLVLLQWKPDVNARGRDGKVPLHCAAINGHMSTVWSLIEKGADSNVQDDMGNTSLHWAAFMGHTDIVELLLRTTNIRLRNFTSRTPLHLAALSGKTVVAKMLMDIEADLSPTDTAGRTALSYAAEIGAHEIVEHMISIPDVPINGNDNYGMSALAWAVAKGDEKMIKLLLHVEDIQVYYQDFDTSPLILAIRRQKPAIARLLLNSGKVDVDEGLLRLAEKGGNADVIELLRTIKQAQSERWFFRSKV